MSSRTKILLTLLGVAVATALGMWLQRSGFHQQSARIIGMGLVLGAPLMIPLRGRVKRTHAIVLAIGFVGYGVMLVALPSAHVAASVVLLASVSCFLVLERRIARQEPLN